MKRLAGLGHNLNALLSPSFHCPQQPNRRPSRRRRKWQTKPACLTVISCCYFAAPSAWAAVGLLGVKLFGLKQRPPLFGEAL